jgi:hypothetical protein
MTFVDRYILGCNCFIATVTFEIAGLGFAQKLGNQVTETMDANIALLNLVVVVLFSLCCYVRAKIFLIPAQLEKLT